MMLCIQDVSEIKFQIDLAMEMSFFTTHVIGIPKGTCKTAYANAEWTFNCKELPKGTILTCNLHSGVNTV